MSKRTGGFIGQDGINAPDEPTDVTGTAGNESVSVAFTTPTDVGASAITGFRAQVGGVGTSGTSSPLVVTGLTNGTAYTANVWTINAFGTSAPSDASASFTPVLGVYVLVAGLGTSYGNAIDVFNINSSADATDFGDLSLARDGGAAIGAATRIVFVGGRDGSNAHLDTMDHLNPTSAGNAADFGNLTLSRKIPAAFGNSTRGLIAGGDGQSISNVIDYITIANTGNATDFGDLTLTTDQTSGFASPTRGVKSGGRGSNSVSHDVIEYVTIANTGNGTDFGNLTLVRSNLGACSSATRGLTAGGFDTGANTNVIDYVTIASAGNATDFGDLSFTRAKIRAASSSTKAVFLIQSKTSDIVTIATTGNGTGFIDLTTKTVENGNMANSNGHGGLT